MCKCGFMNFKLISFLFAWLIFDKKKRKEFKKWCKDVEDNKKSFKLKKYQPRIIERIKNKTGKIKVLFLVSETAKWKAQSLYDLLAVSEKFEPVIAVTLLSKAHKGKDKTRTNIDETYHYFADRGMNVVYAYKNHRYIDLKDFEPDIVFYQQPWYIAKEQSFEKVCKYALVCYIPYYVSDYGCDIDYNQPLHKYLFKHYVINDMWAKIYEELSGLDNFVGLGQPILDAYYLNKEAENQGYVIYAPHYSFSHKNNDNPVNYGTFLKNGTKILEYANQHREIKWVFKPHPQLKFSLLKCGYSEDEVEKYYKDWEELGIACYDSSYMDLFIKSKAMITDSASFLVEYFCSGKPIIHLISDDCKIIPMKPAKVIFDTFYKVHNLGEMYAAFDKVLIKNEDDLKEKRLDVLAQSNLLGNYAAKNIAEDLEKIFM